MANLTRLFLLRRCKNRNDLREGSGDSTLNGRQASDQQDGDEGDDESVLNQSLTFFILTNLCNQILPYMMFSS